MAATLLKANLQPPRRGRRHLPYLVLVIGLALTAVCTAYVAKATASRQRMRFDAAVGDARDAITARIDTYVATLRGMAALFAASDDVTRAEFHQYAQRVGIEPRFPGIQAVGYAQRVAPLQKDTFQAQVREDVADFSIWPDTPRDEYYPTIYLEPYDARNRRAMGFDTSSEPIRRRALERARDDAIAASSGKVDLIGDANMSSGRAGFLIFVPVYRGGAVPETRDARRQQILGLVFAPIVADGLFASIFRSNPNPVVDFGVYDGETTDPRHEIFRSEQPRSAYRPVCTENVCIDIAGLPWTISFSSNPRFDVEAARNLVPWTLFSGVILSLILFGISREEIGARHLAETAAEELRNSEQALRTAKDAAEAANKAKDKFLAMLSHELRTPLTPVLALATAGQNNPTFSESVRADYATIRRNIEMEANLIEDLLDLTKVSRGQLQLRLQTVDVHQALTEALAVCSAEQIDSKRLRVEVERGARHYHVRGDPARLQQVFWNLIQNSVKFTPDGGHITIRTSNPALASPQADTLPEIAVEVIDSGIGIDPVFLPRVFDAFQQGPNVADGNFGGLGLGLAISKGLTDAHGGRISGHSDGLHRGATFRVTLQTVAAPAPAQQPSALSAMDPRAKWSILLVEDHHDTAVALTRLLKAVGYEVQVASSVSDALVMASSAPFDVLLSDISLPDGTGVDLLEELRCAGGGQRTIKAIAITGFGADHDIERSTAAGFAEHLTKPVDFQRLCEAIERVSSQ